MALYIGGSPVIELKEAPAGHDEGVCGRDERVQVGLADNFGFHLESGDEGEPRTPSRNWDEGTLTAGWGQGLDLGVCWLRVLLSALEGTSLNPDLPVILSPIPPPGEATLIPLKSTNRDSPRRRNPYSQPGVDKTQSLSSMRGRGSGG